MMNIHGLAKPDGVDAESPWFFFFFRPWISQSPQTSHNGAEDSDPHSLLGHMFMVDSIILILDLGNCSTEKVWLPCQMILEPTVRVSIADFWLVI